MGLSMGSLWDNPSHVIPMDYGEIRVFRGCYDPLAPILLMVTQIVFVSHILFPLEQRSHAVFFPF